MRVLMPAEMQLVDRRAIEELGVPGLVLMENAALGVVEALLARWPRVERVLVLCGPGNNGGDGLAVARHLAVRGLEVEVVLAAAAASLRDDAATQLGIVERMALAVQEVTSVADLAAVRALLARAELVVDALFGTGLSRPLTGTLAELLATVGALGLPVVAVDLPSGLDGGRGVLLGPHLAADLTVTFAAPKLAHVVAPACHACGEVVVVDLGVPDWLVDEAPGDLHLLVDEELAACLPARPAATHKGDAGHLLLVAGSPGKAGAAILAARAAVRGGAGLVTAAVPAPLLATVDGGSLESMTMALAAGSDGAFATAAADELAAAWRGKSAVAVGPGMGQGEGARLVVETLAAHCPLPLLLDADALNLFAGRPEALAPRPAASEGWLPASAASADGGRSEGSESHDLSAGRGEGLDSAESAGSGVGAARGVGSPGPRAATVITPHPGELARLLGTTVAAVQSDRLAAVREAARRTAAVVVLKGERTLIAEEGEGVWINPTGGPALATGGAGDVLTGLLAAFLAQGIAPLVAAQLAVYLHGRTGDLVAAGGDRGLVAGDLVDHLPRALRSLGERPTRQAVEAR